MSSYGFKLERLKSLVIIAAIILTPALLILLQNDTGSALVYFSFVFVLYREGLSGVVLFFASLVALLFIFSWFCLTCAGNYFTGGCIVMYLVFNPRMKQFLYIVLIFAGSYFVLFVVNFIGKLNFEVDRVLIYGSILGAAVTLIFSVKKRFKNYILISLVFLGAVIFSLSVDYAFNNLLEPHHQERINELLGIESDPLGAGYNVNQSKIAIGSGGFSGKGFLNGTQTKFDFVPEQSTDFIFCTVGEEWGFIGTFTVSLLFLALFVRIVIQAERQRSKFSRIYGYSVAVILFFHYMVNIGMTIGMMPVIGIPLPFFSYGGSSLWSFTILLFIFIRLDASRLEYLSA